MALLFTFFSPFIVSHTNKEFIRYNFLFFNRYNANSGHATISMLTKLIREIKKNNIYFLCVCVCVCVRACVCSFC